jgi:hypothetical protein
MILVWRPDRKSNFIENLPTELTKIYSWDAPANGDNGGQSTYLDSAEVGLQFPRQLRFG